MDRDLISTPAACFLQDGSWRQAGHFDPSFVDGESKPQKALSFGDRDGIDPWAGAFRLPLSGEPKPVEVTGCITAHHAAPRYEVFILFRVYNLVHILRGTRRN